MGADPTASPVTGECSTVELRPRMDKITEILLFSNLFQVPMDGIEPSFEAYESPVLPLNYIGVLLNIAFLGRKSNRHCYFPKK
jgi:hypothetical protein